MGRLATNGEHRLFGMNGVIVDDKARPDSPKTSNVEDHELVGETQLRGAWKENEGVMRDFASCAQQMADAAKGSLLGVEFNRFTRIGKPTANDCIKGAAIARLRIDQLLESFDGGQSVFEERSIDLLFLGGSQ